MVSIVLLNAHPYCVTLTLSRTTLSLRRSSRLFSDDKRVLRLARLALSSTMSLIYYNSSRELPILQTRATYSLLLSSTRQIDGGRGELTAARKGIFEVKQDGLRDTKDKTITLAISN